jgi:hypothetical protein
MSSLKSERISNTKQIVAKRLSPAAQTDFERTNAFLAETDRTLTTTGGRWGHVESEYHHTCLKTPEVTYSWRMKPNPEDEELRKITIIGMITLLARPAAKNKVLSVDQVDSIDTNLNQVAEHLKSLLNRQSIQCIRQGPYESRTPTEIQVQACSLNTFGSRRVLLCPISVGRWSTMPPSHLIDILRMFASHELYDKKEWNDDQLNCYDPETMSIMVAAARINTDETSFDIRPSEILPGEIQSGKTLSRSKPPV